MARQTSAEKAASVVLGAESEAVFLVVTALIDILKTLNVQASASKPNAHVAQNVHTQITELEQMLKILSEADADQARLEEAIEAGL